MNLSNVKEKSHQYIIFFCCLNLFLSEFSAYIYQRKKAKIIMIFQGHFILEKCHEIDTWYFYFYFFIFDNIIVQY
jgi:hypothetical protein